MASIRSESTIRTACAPLLEYLQNQPSSPACILLTTFDDDDALLRGIRLGARGYLLKDVTLELLTEAIHRVYAGDTLFNPALTVRPANP